MIEILRHKEFDKWLKGIKDSRAKASVTSRIDRLAFGLFGDVKPIGNGLSELRISIGKGYRVYFKQRGNKLIIVLCGSQKNDQKQQIEKAKELFKEWEKDNE